MNRKITIFIFFLFGFGYAQSQQINVQKLDSFLTILEQNNKAMGTVSIAKNGSVIYEKSIGYSRFSDEEKILANAETPYHIGSISKMFTAVMIFQLIEENKLTLETKLSDFFPEIPNAKKITIRELLNHRNGLYDFVNDNEDEIWITKPRTQDEILAKIIKGKTHFSPNKKMEYSNTGFLLSAYIIEKVSGKNYNDLLQEKICKPLGLKHTRAALKEVQQNDMATSYSYQNGWNEITDIYFSNVIGVGDITATTNDLIVFNEAFLSGKLISDSNIKLMKPKDDETFGMGMMEVPFYEKIAFGHGGDTYGTHSIIATFEAENLSFAICINGEVYPHNDIAIGVLNICFNKEFDLPKYNLIDYTSEELDKYLGKYSSKDLNLKITISKDNKTMIAKAKGQGAFKLEVTNENEFTNFSEGIVLEFFPAKNEFILKQSDYKFLYKKEK